MNIAINRIVVDPETVDSEGRDHTNVTHGYILKRESRPLCEHCNEPLTDTHLICEYLAYINIRETCNIRSILKENLYGKSENTLQFCEDINAYKMKWYDA